MNFLNLPLGFKATASDDGTAAKLVEVAEHGETTNMTEEPMFTMPAGLNNNPVRDAYQVS